MVILRPQPCLPYLILAPISINTLGIYTHVYVIDTCARVSLGTGKQLCQSKGTQMPTFLVWFTIRVEARRSYAQSSLPSLHRHMIDDRSGRAVHIITNFRLSQLQQFTRVLEGQSNFRAIEQSVPS